MKRTLYKNALACLFADERRFALVAFSADRTGRNRAVIAAGGRK